MGHRPYLGEPREPAEGRLAAPEGGCHLKRGAAGDESPCVYPSRRAIDAERVRLVDEHVDAERRRTAFLQRLPDPGNLTDAQREELKSLDALVRSTGDAYYASLKEPAPPWEGPERRRPTTR